MGKALVFVIASSLSTHSDLKKYQKVENGERGKVRGRGVFRIGLMTTWGTAWELRSPMISPVGSSIWALTPALVLH